MTIRAFPSIGPYTGIRIFSEADTSTPLAYIDKSDREQLLEMAVRALKNDYIDLEFNGVEYRMRAGFPLARQIIDVLSINH